MGATEEQMALLAAAHVSHVSYILILYSISFLLFLFVSMLLHLYATYTWPIDVPKSKLTASREVANGHVPGQSVDRRVRDAEEFELEGLMSEDEEGENGTPADGRGKENGVIS